MKANDLVAYNLKRLRVRAGISQERLALDSGIDRTYVSRIERQMENCTVGILERLAEVIGCRIGEFFDEPTDTPLAPLKSGRKPKRPQ